MASPLGPPVGELVITITYFEPIRTVVQPLGETVPWGVFLAFSCFLKLEDPVRAKWIINLNSKSTTNLIKK